MPDDIIQSDDFFFADDVRSGLRHHNRREHFNCLSDAVSHSLLLGADFATRFPFCGSPKPLFEPSHCRNYLVGWN